MKKLGRWSSISKKKLNLDLSDLKRLGLDEIAMRKGQDEFIVVLI